MFQSMTWAFQITIVDLTTRPGSKVMTFQRHHYQPDSGQPFKPFSAVNLTVSGFPVRIGVAPYSTVSGLMARNAMQRAKPWTDKKKHET